MKFYKPSVFTSVMLAVSLFSISLLAHAADLSFANDTNVTLTASVNHVCSPQFGVLEQHTLKVIKEESFKEACQYNQSNCYIKIYNTANCTGTHIETMILDTSNGIVGLEGGDDDGQYYYWSANGFNLYVSNH